MKGHSIDMTIIITEIVSDEIHIIVSSHNKFFLVRKNKKIEIKK